MKRTLFEVHIEELTLRGFERVNKEALVAAIKDSLARQLADGLLDGARPGAVAEADGGSFTVTAPSSSAALGAKIAGAVRRGVSAR